MVTRGKWRLIAVADWPSGESKGPEKTHKGTAMGLEVTEVRSHSSAYETKCKTLEAALRGGFSTRHILPGGGPFITDAACGWTGGDLEGQPPSFHHPMLALPRSLTA